MQNVPQMGFQWGLFHQAQREASTLTEPLVQWSVLLLEQRSHWCLFVSSNADLPVKCQLSGEKAISFPPPLMYLHWAQQGLDIIWDHSEVELTNTRSWADAFT